MRTSNVNKTFDILWCELNQFQNTLQTRKYSGTFNIITHSQFNLTAQRHLTS